MVCYFLFLPFDNSAVVQFCEVPKIWLHGAISQTNLIFETDFQAFMERKGSREGLQRIRTTLQRTDAAKQSSWISHESILITNQQAALYIYTSICCYAWIPICEPWKTESVPRMLIGLWNKPILKAIFWLGVWDTLWQWCLRINVDLSW